MALHPKVRAGILIGLLALTFAGVYWADSLPEVESASADVSPPRNRDSRPEQSNADSSALDLQKLQRVRPSDPDADPFGPRNFRPPPPKLNPAMQAGALALAPPPPPKAPPLPFVYMGRLSEEQRTTVFLTSGDRNLVVKPGDLIDNTYKVEEVTDSSVVLTYLPMKQRQTLAIGTP
jgi:hypothetical protein